MFNASPIAPPDVPPFDVAGAAQKFAFVPAADDDTTIEIRHQPLPALEMVAELNVNDPTLALLPTTPFCKSNQQVAALALVR